jgi:hypothetical protein
LRARRRSNNASLCWPPILPKRDAFGPSGTRASRSGGRFQPPRAWTPCEPSPAAAPKRTSAPAAPAAKPPASAGGYTKSSGGARNSARQLGRSGSAAPGGGRARRRQLRLCEPAAAARPRRGVSAPRHARRRRAADLWGGGVTARCGEDTHEHQPQHQHGRAVQTALQRRWRMALLPLNPAWAHTLLLAPQFGCVVEALTCAALLSVEPVFLLPSSAGAANSSSSSRLQDGGCSDHKDGVGARAAAAVARVKSKRALEALLKVLGGGLFLNATMLIDDDGHAGAGSSALSQQAAFRQSSSGSRGGVISKRTTQLRRGRCARCRCPCRCPTPQSLPRQVRRATVAASPAAAAAAAAAAAGRRVRPNSRPRCGHSWRIPSGAARPRPRPTRRAASRQQRHYGNAAAYATCAGSTLFWEAQAAAADPAESRIRDG